jgi:hypothetical protein
MKNSSVNKLLDLFYSLSESEKSEFLGRITAPAAFAGGGTINFGSRKSNICDYCGELATNSCPDPYAQDIHNDSSDAHFWCNNPICGEKCDNDCAESAADI